MATQPNTYLRPKVSTAGAGEKMKRRGMFIGNQPYPQLGGFSSPSKFPKADSMGMERGGPQAAKGKPI